MIINLNKENFETEVLKSDKPVLVDFWAQWCGPCKMMAPILEDIDKNRPDIKICKVDIDENSELAIEYNIMSIPTFLAFKDGKILNRLIGAQSADSLIQIFNS